MTAAAFRKLALGLPEATESAHMGHPDFRVRNKIFATLSHRPGFGMVKLTPELQAQFIAAAPETFAPVGGAWGRGGATEVRLAAAPARVVRQALWEAWRRAAPPSLIAELESDEAG